MWTFVVNNAANSDEIINYAVVSVLNFLLGVVDKLTSKFRNSEPNRARSRIGLRS